MGEFWCSRCLRVIRRGRFWYMFYDQAFNRKIISPNVLMGGHLRSRKSSPPSGSCTSSSRLLAIFFDLSPVPQPDASWVRSESSVSQDPRQGCQAKESCSVVNPSTHHSWAILSRLREN